MSLQVQPGFLSDGMTYLKPKTQQVDLNLLFIIHTVINRYKKDAIGLLVPRNEVFEKSLYHRGTISYFNRALSGLKDKKLVILTPFTLALTQAGLKRIYGTQPGIERTFNAPERIAH